MTEHVRILPTAMLGWCFLAYGLAACESADVGRCGEGGEPVTPEDGATYCVYRASTPARAMRVECPDDLVFRLQIENIIICSDESRDSAADLPDAVCRRAQLLACGAASSDAGSADGGLDAGAGYHVEGDVVPGTRRGSTEGEEYYSSCSTGQVMAGLDGVTNSAMAGSTNVHMLTPSCRTLMPDGTLGSPMAQPPIGTECGGTSTPYEDRCPEGSVLVGLHGEIQQPCPPPGCGGDIVAELGLTCAPLEAWVADGGGVVQLPVVGEFLGTVITTFDERCDRGFAVTELRGTQRCAQFSIQLGCRRIAR